MFNIQITCRSLNVDCHSIKARYDDFTVFLFRFSSYRISSFFVFLSVFFSHTNSYFLRSFALSNKEVHVVSLDTGD